MLKPIDGAPTSEAPRLAARTKTGMARLDPFRAEINLIFQSLSPFSFTANGRK
jgi:hypothetical protein